MPPRAGGLVGALGAVAAVGLGVAGLLAVNGTTGFQPLGAPVVDLGVPALGPAQVRDESAPLAGPVGPLGPVAAPVVPVVPPAPVPLVPPAPASDLPAPVVPAPVVPAPVVPAPLASSPTGAPFGPVPPVSPSQPRPAVLVFNNSRIGDLGERAAASLRDGGWSVRDVGSFSGRFRTSTVYFEPGQRAAAERLAEQYGVPRVLPRLAALPGSGMTVVVTRDWGS